ncbi:MAG: hypothetical protein LBU32_06100 [Clostridiales bacterium]|nr:hypothetical protein [Clostridiales bacterium]
MGESVPVYEILGELAAEVSLPAIGAAVLLPKCASLKISDDDASASITDNGAVLKNGEVTVTFSQNGEITSFLMNHSGCEACSCPSNRFRLFKDVPRLFDAWDIDSNYELGEIVLDGKAEMTLIASTPIYSAIKIEKRIGDSILKQTASIKRGSACVEFDAEIEWRELHKLLKVSFATDIASEEFINEIQYGFIKRPATRSRQYDKDRFEVCSHKYAALAAGNRTAAVLNDCKYGASAVNGEISLTLLRASSSPAMRGDNGLQSFVYAFAAWDAPFLDSNVARAGYEINVPAVAEAFCGRTISWIGQFGETSAILDAVKPADDESGDIILRLYESKGSFTSYTVI